MKLLSLALVGMATSVSLFAQPIQPRKTHLKVGDEAPDFTLNATTGGKVNSRTSGARTPSSSPFSPLHSPVAEPRKSRRTRLVQQNSKQTILKYLESAPITPRPKKNSPQRTT